MAVVNIVGDQGANLTYTIDVTDANGAAMNLASYTATAIFKKHQGSANSYTFTCNAYANGSVILTMNAATSANIADGRYVYDAFIESSNGQFTKIQEGILTINPSVTR